MAFPLIDMYATGQRINTVRKEKGISIKDMMMYFGFKNPNSLYKWFRGESLPSLDNMFALSLLLGVSVNDLMVSMPSSIAI